MTDRLSDTDLAAMKEREAAATPGPWHYQWNPSKVVTAGTDRTSVTACYNQGNEQDDANAEFIAHAREDVPLLIADLEAKTAEVEALRAENENQSAEIDRLRAIVNAQKKRPGQRTLIERARNARHENKWLHKRVRRAEAESAELRQALVRAVAREAELVALLDPDNDEAVEIVRRNVPDGSPQKVLAALRDAANGEG